MTSKVKDCSARDPSLPIISFRVLRYFAHRSGELQRIALITQAVLQIEYEIALELLSRNEEHSSRNDERTRNVPKSSQKLAE